MIVQDAVFKLQARGMEVGSLHGGQSKQMVQGTRGSCLHAVIVVCKVDARWGFSFLLRCFDPK